MGYVGGMIASAKGRNAFCKYFQGDGLPGAWKGVVGFLNNFIKKVFL